MKNEKQNKNKEEEDKALIILAEKKKKKKKTAGFFLLLSFLLFIILVATNILNLGLTHIGSDDGIVSAEPTDLSNYYTKSESNNLFVPYLNASNNTIIVNYNVTANNFFGYLNWSWIQNAPPSSSSTYNATYDMFAYNQTAPAITYGNLNYYSILNPLNFINHTQASVYNDTTLITNVNSSLWSYITSNVGSWLSTYNSTYNTFSYNQTTPFTNWLSSFVYNYNQSDGSYNATYEQFAYNQTNALNPDRQTLCWTTTNAVGTSRYLGMGGILNKAGRGWRPAYNGSLLSVTMMASGQDPGGIWIAGTEPNITISLNISNTKTYSNRLNLLTQTAVFASSNYSARGVYNFTTYDNVTAFVSTDNTGTFLVASYCVEYVYDQ